MLSYRLYSSHTEIWDRVGMAVSLLCVVHCVATPALAATPFILAALGEQAHGMFALTVLMVGLLAFVPGYRVHGRKDIPLLALLGFGLIAAAALLPEAADLSFMEAPLTFTGGFAMITAHFRNAYFCQRCRKCQGASCGFGAVDGTRS